MKQEKDLQNKKKFTLRNKYKIHDFSKVFPGIGFRDI